MGRTVFESLPAIWKKSSSSDFIIFFNSQDPGRIKTIATALICRVEAHPICIKIDISQPRLASLLASSSIDRAAETLLPDNDPKSVLTLTAPAGLQMLGREMKLLVDESDKAAQVDASLVRLIARAHDIQARLSLDTTLTVHDIAREERIGALYIYVLLRLAWLAPDIVTAIVNGRQPRELNAKKLMRLTAQLPGDWAAQRRLLGFS